MPSASMKSWASLFNPFKYMVVVVVVQSPSHVQPLDTPWTIAHQAPCPCKFPGNNNGVGFPFPLQGLFPTQESNQGLPHCRWILYQLSHHQSTFKHILHLISSYFSHFFCLFFPFFFLPSSIKIAVRTAILIKMF